MGDTDAVAIAASIEVPARFDVVYERHRPTIFRYVARRVGPADAPDVTADVFVRAFGIRHRYDTTRPDALPWLYGIAANVVAGHRRHLAVRARRSAGVAAGWLDRPDDHADRAAAVADLEAERERLVDALGRLRRRDRDVLLAVALDQLSYDQVAEAFDMPVGTVRSTVNRARRRMRELLGVGEEREDDA